jgi:hypothetical protein
MKNKDYNDYNEYFDEQILNKKDDIITLDLKDLFDDMEKNKLSNHGKITVDIKEIVHCNTNSIEDREETKGKNESPRKVILNPLKRVESRLSTNKSKGNLMFLNNFNTRVEIPQINHDNSNDVILRTNQQDIININNPYLRDVNVSEAENLNVFMNLRENNNY